MITYSIKDIERISGIKAHTLRIWEKRYAILKPKRSETNIRYYGSEDLKKVLNIAILQQHGMRISKIVEMPQEEIVQRVLDISENDGDRKTQIENLMLAMLDLDETRFERTLANCILRFGFKETLLQIVYPFFFQVGMLWQTGSVNPGQEHFISNLIRQKLIVAIDNEGMKSQKGGKTFLLFLPEGELHELGILFYNYLIRQAGHSVIYLGQSVPIEDAVAVNSQITADYVVTSIHKTNSQDEFEGILQDILTAFPETEVILTNRIDFVPQISNSKRLLRNLSMEALNELLTM